MSGVAAMVGRHPVDPLHAMQFRPPPPPQVRAVHPAQRPPSSDRDCPLDTAGDRCLWHAGGTAGENDAARSWRRRLRARPGGSPGWPTRGGPPTTGVGRWRRIIRGAVPQRWRSQSEAWPRPAETNRVRRPAPARNRQPGLSLTRPPVARQALDGLSLAVWLVSLLGCGPWPRSGPAWRGL
jgi:hypothetical protein